LSHPLRLGVGLGLLAWGVVSCSLLVGGESEPLRCSLEGRVGPPACDPGLVCQNGTCRPLPAAGGAPGGTGDGGGGA
jgi:hypothetical protein